MTNEFDVTDLFGIVDAYAAFGNHHTGTDVDRATTRWLVDLLQGLGAEVEEDPFAFDRFSAAATLTAQGVAVPCLPLFYSATGSIMTSEFDVIEVPSNVVGNAHAIEPLLPPNADGRPLVIAIEGPDDLAVQCNRIPTEMLGRLAVVIPSNWLDRVRSGAELTFEASLLPGTSANVIATFGAADAPAVMITTPLTGWTPAAGERGTGLAAAILIATALSSTRRVVFSACAGHEIDHLGLRHHLATHDVAGDSVVHLGASVASCEPNDNGELELGTRRMTLTTATGRVRAAIADRVGDANWSMPDLDPPWPGEGGTWLDAGASVLSFLGDSSLFHTVEDVTARATTPEAVHLAANVALDAVRIFLSGVDA